MDIPYNREYDIRKREPEAVSPSYENYSYRLYGSISRTYDNIPQTTRLSEGFLNYPTYPENR